MAILLDWPAELTAPGDALAIRPYSRFDHVYRRSPRQWYASTIRFESAVIRALRRHQRNDYGAPRGEENVSERSRIGIP